MRLRIVMILLLACATLVSVTLTGEAAAPAETYHEVWITATSADDIATLAVLGVIIHEAGGAAVRAWVPESTLSVLNRAGFQYRPVDEPEDTGPAAKQNGLEYPTYAEITEALQTYHALYPDITALYTLGQSIEGRELWALLITDNPGVLEDEPAFKYIASMHGDEPLGTPFMLYLIDRLLTGYLFDQRITDLVNETAIWIVPLMNPDRYNPPAGGARGNANNVDLNRNFPLFPQEFTGFIFDGAPLRDAGRQPETQHVMRWSAENSFVLSANIHTGALVVNYPYDDDAKGSTFSPTPDQDVFEHISRVYAQYNPPMFASPHFEEGITNGAEWFRITGGMQDWNYRYLGTKEVTLELSIQKTPPASQLAQLWADNQESLLAYLEQVHIGVRGIVTDATTNEPVYARVRVAGRTQPVFSNPEVGNYHRLLLPGQYNITFEAPGYAPLTANNIVVEQGLATRLDVTLHPTDNAVVPNLVGMNFEAAQATLASAGFTLGTVDHLLDADIPRDQVLAQSPPAGVMASIGAAINLTLSLGAPGAVQIDLTAQDTGARFTTAVLTVDPPLFSLINRNNGTYSNFAPGGEFRIRVIEAGPYQVPITLYVTVVPGDLSYFDIELVLPDPEAPIPGLIDLQLFAQDTGQPFTEALITVEPHLFELTYQGAGFYSSFAPAGDYRITIVEAGPYQVPVALDVAIAEGEIRALAVNLVIPDPDDPTPGDVNGDGIVDAVDVQLVINAALGINIDPHNADLNDDGQVNAVDVQLVINAALGISIE